MITDPVTYQQLENALFRLGFTRQRVEPKWLRYEHPESDTVIVLVEKKPSARVRITDAVSARRHLLEKGLVGAQELEAFLTGNTTSPETAAGKRS